MAKSAAPEARVSLNCAHGNHSRCLGTVYDVSAGRLVRCGCTVADCGHGTDTAKARRARGEA